MLKECSTFNTHRFPDWAVRLGGNLRSASTPDITLNSFKHGVS
jgi:hypothetical protein